MTGLRVLLSRLLDPFVRGRRERELAEEIESHLQLLTEEHLRRGLSVEAARAAAKRDFGGVEQVKDVHRQHRGLPFVDELLQDLRFAVRLLAKDRRSTAVATGALAIGLAACNTVFTFVNATRIRGLPVDEAERVMSIHRVDASGRPGSVSYDELLAMQLEATAFEGIAGFRRSASTVSDSRLAPEQIRSLYLSANAFGLLRVSPALGRDFLPEEDRPGAPPVVLLGESVFQGRFGGDSGIIGRRIRLNGVDTTVIGVMPAGFHFDYFADLWQPLPGITDLAVGGRNLPQLNAFGRLAPRAELADARAQLQVIGRRRQHPGESETRLTAGPFTGSIFDDPVMPALLGAVGFVLLIACANVASLRLGAATLRAREIAIRTAIGATRPRILRQLMAESAVLVTIAASAGFGLSIVGVRLLSRAISDIPIPYWVHFTMDGRVLLFIAAASLAAAMAFGLAPALHLSRASLLSLKAMAAVGARRWTTGLLATQVALTIALLAGAGLMLRSFLTLYHLDNAVDTTGLISMAVRLPDSKYPSDRDRESFFNTLCERLAGSSAVASVTTASTFPFAGASARKLVLEGDPGSRSSVSYLTIGSDYFATLGLRLTAGQDFNHVDGSEGHGAAIVNQLLATTFFPGENPIGKRMGIAHEGVAPSWVEIVGVAPDVRQRLLAGPDPTVYVPSRADPQPFAILLVRGTYGTEAVVSLVRDEVRALDSELPVYAITEVDRVRSQSRWPNRVFGILFAIFAVIALSLSAVGLYAIVSHGVSQRVHEIGVRIALGAQARQILWLVTRGTILPMTLGLAAGFLAALGVGRLLQSVLVRTSPNDALTLLAIGGLVALVATAAYWLSARRAISLDPVEALRCE